MLIMCRVCAQFRDKRGNVIFTVDQGLMDRFTEAPDAIQEDPLFAMLCADHSIEANLTPVQRKTVENDPMAGMDPSGKRKTAKAATGGNGKTDNKVTDQGEPETPGAEK